MPFVSQSQARKFALLLEQGKISQKTFDEWHAATPDVHKLPEHVKKARAAVKPKFDARAKAL
jgi:hypothetical protein